MTLCFGKSLEESDKNDAGNDGLYGSQKSGDLHVCSFQLFFQTRIAVHMMFRFVLNIIFQVRFVAGQRTREFFNSLAPIVPSWKDDF